LQNGKCLKRTRHTKGDRVLDYLPMIPELAITTACAELEPFTGCFLQDFPLRQLQQESTTANVKWSSLRWWISREQNHFKSIVDEALLNCPCVENVLVAKRINSTINMKEGRPMVATLLDQAG
jgi:acetyl-CoA synthetase